MRSMKINYTPAHIFTTNAWANGTTTELVKYPPESDFVKRDFIFRMSTATVEAEESTFSDFSGLTRILMVLEGAITLIHEGRYQKHLNPYDQDTFDGSWSTKSIGKVRDFNLMCNHQAEGKSRAFSLNEMEKQLIPLTQKRVVLFIHTGRFRCFDQTLNAGDVLDIESSDCKAFDLECLLGGTLVLSEIKFK
jgi:environmental stress-induced protein Ves